MENILLNLSLNVFIKVVPMKRKVIYTGHLLGSKLKTLRVTRFQALKIVVKPTLGIIPLVPLFVSQTKG